MTEKIYKAFRFNIGKDINIGKDSAKERKRGKNVEKPASPVPKMYQNKKNAGSLGGRMVQDCLPFLENAPMHGIQHTDQAYHRRKRR